MIVNAYERSERVGDVGFVFGQGVSCRFIAAALSLHVSAGWEVLVSSRRLRVSGVCWTGFLMKQWSHFSSTNALQQESARQASELVDIREMPEMVASCKPSVTPKRYYTPRRGP